MRIAIVSLLGFLCVVPVVAQPDVKGSSDHPIFPTRMPGFYIGGHQVKGFAARAFRTKPATTVEGRYTRIDYRLEKGKESPGGLAVRRNYENAMKAAGGEILQSDSVRAVMKGNHAGKETWVEMTCSTSGQGAWFTLHIVERETMEQVVTADVLGAEIDKQGFVALDIHFATGKADILPESMPAIDQVAEMLAKRPGILVDVEGHTDNTGTPALNKPLSQERAKSVAAALAMKGIDAKRMSPAGFGQDQPVADNNTEEGRAKNRRVVIRKRS